MTYRGLLFEKAPGRKRQVHDAIEDFGRIDRNRIGLAIAIGGIDPDATGRQICAGRGIDESTNRNFWITVGAQPDATGSLHGKGIGARRFNPVDDAVGRGITPHEGAVVIEVHTRHIAGGQTVVAPGFGTAPARYHGSFALGTIVSSPGDNSIPRRGAIRPPSTNRGTVCACPIVIPPRHRAGTRLGSI